MFFSATKKQKRRTTFGFVVNAKRIPLMLSCGTRVRRFNQHMRVINKMGYNGSKISTV
jgi:hypothetical protein